MKLQKVGMSSVDLSLTLLDALADGVTDTDESGTCDAFGAEWSSLEEAHVLAEEDRHIGVNVWVGVKEF